MKLLWKEHPLTCRQIEDVLKEDTGWTRHTIISFLKRMMEKEYVCMKEGTPARLYYPLLNKETTVLQEGIEKKDYVENIEIVDKLFSILGDYDDAWQSHDSTVYRFSLNKAHSDWSDFMIFTDEFGNLEGHRITLSELRK